jgi:uncharacterized protein YacL
MRMIYRKQIPGQPPMETRIGSWVAALIGILIALGVLIVFLLIIPLALLGLLAFIAFVLVAMVAGWIYLGFRIGFRNLWDVTKLMFGIGFGPSSGASRTERLRRAWEERVKGGDGVWMK